MPSAHEVPQLMPQVRQSLEVHGVIHEVLPCPDELSDTALTVQLTGMQIGGVTPFGIEGLPIYVDNAVLEQDHLIMGGGNRTSKIRPVPTELGKLPAVVLVAGLATPKEEAAL